MKLMFISDIHGSPEYLEKIIEKYKKESFDKLILLGDVLYHGPRNTIPVKYDPQKVVELLNNIKEGIIAVRGNCDSEIDRALLEFPLDQDYITIFEKQRAIYITHGHIYNKDHKPMMKQNDILIYGHTHIYEVDIQNNYIFLNPGSITIPKQNNPNSYMTYEEGRFQILDFVGNVLEEYKI